MSDVFPIKILSKQDQNVLAEFSFDKLESAYKSALQYEDLGLDIELIIPGATTTLAQSLKVPQSQISRLAKEFDDEINDHEH